MLGLTLNQLFSFLIDSQYQLEKYLLQIHAAIMVSQEEMGEILLSLPFHGAWF